MTKYYEPEATPENPVAPAPAASSKTAPKKPSKPLPSPKKNKATRQIETKDEASEYPTALDTKRLKSWWSKYKVPRGSDDKVAGLLLSWEGPY